MRTFAWRFEEVPCLCSGTGLARLVLQDAGNAKPEETASRGFDGGGSDGLDGLQQQRHGSVCRQFDQLDSGRFQRGGAAESGDGDALQLAVFGRIGLEVVRLFGGDDD